MEKKVTSAKIKNHIYKVVSPMTSHLYKDQDWSGVASILSAIRQVLANLSDTLDLRVRVEDGGYRQNDGTHWKEYLLAVVDETTGKQVVAGHLNAHGAGTISDPFDRYDMTVVLY